MKMSEDDSSKISGDTVVTEHQLTHESREGNAKEEKDVAKPQPGVAVLKDCYLIKEEIPKQLNLEFISKEDREKLDSRNEGEPPHKRMKLSKREKKALRSGQNKKRVVPKRWDPSERLCFSVRCWDEGTEKPQCSFKNCTFSHDVEKFRANMTPFTDQDCPNYKTFGRCPFGITCRFGSSHLTEDGKNKINHELQVKYANGQNWKSGWSGDLQLKLRKRQYQFTKSEAAIRNFSTHKQDQKVNNQKEDNKQRENKKTYFDSDDDDDNLGSSTKDVTTGGKEETEEDKVQELAVANGDEKEETDDGKEKEPVVGNDCEKEEISKQLPSGNSEVIDDANIKPTQREKKKIDWAGKLYLSPLTTVGNMPFRRICKKLGADITCSEMAMSFQLLKGVRHEWTLLKRHESEDIYGAQICGNNPELMTRCAELLEADGCVDFVDINMGCPLDPIFKSGAGSGLLRRKNTLDKILHGMTDVLSIPLTVKTRTGCNYGKNIIDQFVPVFKKYNVSLVTLHGRARDQRYTKMADWDYIGKFKEQLDPIPLFGNGDILSYEDYAASRKQSGVEGVMIGRGALIKPWIFTELKEQRNWDISATERFDLLKDYANYGMECWGSDSSGVETTRRFLLEWLSFYHRYIPVGLLEQPPQKINARPPAYRGRCDLETLLASPSCRDWIKISEMLLGPVPSDFSFIPKHKAAAWS